MPSSAEIAASLNPSEAENLRLLWAGAGTLKNHDALHEHRPALVRTIGARRHVLTRTGRAVVKELEAK